MAETNNLIVLDRDGVINHDSEDYIKTPEEWRPLDGSLDAIAALTASGYRVVVVSNQSGIGRGLFSEAVLDEIHRKMTSAVEAAGGAIAGIYYCPHTPDEGCNCRKPRPGLLERIQDDFDVSLSGIPFVGDKVADMALARRVGARPMLVLTGYGRATLASLTDTEVETFPDLASATTALLAERGE
jgi:D-glycero-D-manno-heptose 1,7-bisphosphate phosphatase